MSSLYSKDKQFGALALGLLSLHVVLMLAFPQYPIKSTYPFWLLVSFLALLACSWRARRAGAPARLPWMLFSLGLALWWCGMLLGVWQDLFERIPDAAAFFSDFVYFLWGVPTLLAISYPSEEESIPLFVWLDGIQALLTACLTYVALFDVIPFSPITRHPLSAVAMGHVYVIENLMLVSAATLRLFAQPRRAEERYFSRVLCIFLWIYTAVAWLYNHNFLHTRGNTVSSLVLRVTINAAVDIPFLFLTAMAILPLARDTEYSWRAPRGQFATIVDQSSPILYTIALLTLGVYVLRGHFGIGIAAVFLALVVYGIRMVALQSRYRNSQTELQQARDQLEELSLQDGLTGIANRRCLDRAFEREWMRAFRTRDPLSLLLIDIDYFKSLNDKHGHRYGDQCLVSVAWAVRSALRRPTDLLARYGGEEFAVLLVSTGPDGAHALAESIQQAVAMLEISNDTSIGQHLSVSIGLATYQAPEPGSLETLVEAADQALYRAKETGRNRIVSASTLIAVDR